MEIKGPFSYSGNKYKIYKNHLKEVLQDFDYTIELFGGSSPLVYNSKRGGVIVDIDPFVCFLHTSLKNENLIERIGNLYDYYFSKGRNKESYLKMRNDFNEIYIKKGLVDELDAHLHLLIQLSFNSLLRYSKNGYNVPFGRKEIDLERIKNHVNIFVENDIKVFNITYDKYKFDKNLENFVIYLDPPYIASNYQYNNSWVEKDELKLLRYIDSLNDLGYKWILSNTIYHRGKENLLLKEWCKKYQSKIINKKYNSWTAAVHSVKSENSTVEIIVSNIKF